ncbi:SDR family oxidoreductase, partial [candidate division KSB1 bacterium]|nr:SDR family oxidoreductase [candidate division KSB1 bacterium]
YVMSVDQERRLKAAEQLFLWFFHGAQKSVFSLNEILIEIGSKVTVESRNDLTWRLTCHFNSCFLVFTYRVFSEKSSEEATAEIAEFFTSYLKIHLADSVLPKDRSNFSIADQEQGRLRLEQDFLDIAQRHTEAYVNRSYDEALKEFSGIVFHELQESDDREEYIRVTSHVYGYVASFLPSIMEQAENFRDEHGAHKSIAVDDGMLPEFPHLDVARLRKAVSYAAETAMITRVLRGKEERGFANLPNVSEIAARGPLTPDHVFRAKHIPMIMTGNTEDDVNKFAERYRDYFDRNADGALTCLDPAPRWAVWRGQGIAVMGKNLTDVNIVTGIAQHTIRAIQWGEAIGGWKALEDSEIFEIEYWELEQAKLKKGGTPPPFQGKIALITGAASGIGKACAEALSAQGAVVAGLDINPEIENNIENGLALGIACDVTDQKAVGKAVERTVEEFGGLDILVSNAGTFPSSMTIEEQDAGAWNKSIDLNLNSHRSLLQECIPYLKYGIDPAVVIIGSKNVPAPGPGASAYSVAKAGLTQLARVAALELGQFGIRVNIVHPNMVFDTGIWTPEVLETRAKHYGVTVEEYKTSNLLKTEVTSQNVAELVVTMAGPAFAKTTGAQIPIDGGNERVV